MRFDTLEEWLQWQLLLHFKSIDLGLERVSAVASRLGIGRIANEIIIVAGTNGKGSTVACYENWLHNAGYTVGSYSSPHLLRYNERIKLNLEMATDDQICKAFDEIDRARDNVALTYFEFGTLAALWLIQLQRPDFAILEVGLGGRLDAVNIIDADLVHFTSIGIDHQNWLGEGREKIGFEKAGVLRTAIPVICNDAEPPRSVTDEILRLKCRALLYRHDFNLSHTDQPNLYKWRNSELTFEIELPLPGLHQVQNVAGVIAGLSQLVDLTTYNSTQVNDNFIGTQLQGRFQSLQTEIAAKVYIDVGHNQDAARALASNLAVLHNPSGRVVVLLGMLEDKESPDFVRAMAAEVDDWWLLSLDCDRGLSAAELALRLKNIVEVEQSFVNARLAFEHALSSLTNQDIILVTGSFITVEQFLGALPVTDSIKH